MLAVLHNNENVDAENRGERIIERRTPRIGRANDHPNDRIHRTVVYSWQKLLLDEVKAAANRAIDYDHQLVDQFVQLNINRDPTEEDVENLDLFFEDFASTIIL